MAPRLRQRYRDDEVFVVGRDRIYQPGGLLYADIIESKKFATYYETISDVVNSSGRINPTTHSRVRVTMRSHPSLTNTENGWYDQHELWFHPIVGGGPESVFGYLTSVALARLADNAFEALWPQIPQEVSIPNFLYELRELGDLIPSLEDSLSKTVANGYLNYSFGWKPLIGDIQKLANLNRVVLDRIAYLKRTWGRETRISTQESFTISDMSPSPVDGYSLLEFHGIFRAGGYLYHELEGLDSLEGLLRGFAGALGLNNPLGVVWEAIPFSFVADWFGRAQSAINRQAVQPFVGTWEIRRLSHSIKFWGAWKGPTIDFDPQYSPNKWDTMDGTYEWYRRDAGLPVSSSLLSATELSPAKQALAAALIRGLSK